MKKKTDYKKQGKKNRSSGQRFELKVRKDLEKKGWIVSKWMNNLSDAPEFKTKVMISAKRKYNPFKKVMMMSGGMPDFLAFRRLTRKKIFEMLKNEI